MSERSRAAVSADVANVAVPADCGERRSWSSWISGFKEPLVARAMIPVRTLVGPRDDSAFGILMYHRIARRTRGASRPTWNVTPRRFAAQLRGLLARGYEAWPLQRVLDHTEAAEPIPGNVFVVTFDDGYENNFTEAWPILRELGIPATIFLATAYLESDAPFPSDDWDAAGSPAVPPETWRPMTFAQCEQLLEDGSIELGAHTHTHADFRGRPDDLAADLRRNQQVLRERLGIERPTFAFPYGTKRLGFSGGELMEVARRSGMRCSLTTEDRLVTAGSDPFDWGRFTAHQSDTPATLAVKLDGWFGVAQRLWRARLGGSRTVAPVTREGDGFARSGEPATDTGDDRDHAELVTSANGPTTVRPRTETVR